LTGISIDARTPSGLKWQENTAAGRKLYLNLYVEKGGG
jgi:hypothetical protein